MNSEILYKVYYSDGSIFVGTEDNVGDTPIFEVLAIVEKDRNHGRKVVSNGDFYIFQNKKWIACDYWTMIQYMARKGMEKRFLIGVMVEEETWNKTITLARHDPDFPTQTAFHLYERREG